MLEDLSGQEFEAWCKVLFEREYGCEVEDMPHTGDEGRDLIIHHPQDPIVVECKHRPDGTVGRPDIQKLHSAVLTARTNRGIAVTTGRFTQAAMEYVESLKTDIGLIDGTQLAYLAEKVGLAAEGSEFGDRSAQAVVTTSDERFPDEFEGRVYRNPRYHPGNGYAVDLRIDRETQYDGYYIAKFEAEGILDTARGRANASWDGWATCRHDGRRAPRDSPSAEDILDSTLRPLGEVLELTEGPTKPPMVQPHDAIEQLRNQLVERLGKDVTYTGRNNVTYTREIKPKKHDTHVHDIQLVYVPRQHVQVGNEEHAVEAELQEKDGTYHLRSEDFSVCCICNRGLKEDDQVFCVVCLRAAHDRGFLTPDSFRCETCDATICYDHARRDDQGVVCTRCASADAKPARKRWLPHVGLGVGTPFLLSLWAVATPGSQALLVLLATIASWWPAWRVVRKGKGEPEKEWMEYSP